MGFDTTTGLAIALMINVVLFLSQTAVCEVNPSSCPLFYQYEGSDLQTFDQGNQTLDVDYAGQLPTGQTSPSPDSGGNIFTDPFGTLKNWLLSISGGEYVVLFITAFPNALASVNLPQEISFALGALWYGYAFVSVILVLFGRNS